MTNDVVIRRLHIGEAEIYRKVRLDALNDSPEAFATNYESALVRTEDSWITQADASAQGSDRATFLVFSSQPIGLAAIYRDPADLSTGELIQMWIAPSHRGIGVAGKLLDHLFGWALQHDFKNIRAEIARGNSKALGFYKRYGFRANDLVSDPILLIKEVAPIRSRIE